VRVLFANIPFIETRNGQLWTGPNAGSCWPHTAPGLYNYVPFPFFMANAASYLKLHGVECEMFDAWAERYTDYAPVRARIEALQTEMLVLEAGTPVIEQVLAMASWAKAALGCKVVLTGSHFAGEADEYVGLSFVDCVVVGEYDLACLKLARGDTRRLIVHDQVEDINHVNGHNWKPYRPQATLANYLDPSMVATPIQLQVNDARGCSWRCSYCSWPSTMYKQFRVRAAANVLDEIRQVQAHHRVGSLFFDSETFGSGPKQRLKDLAAGLKSIGLPWSMMSRIDVSTPEEFEMFADAGCVGMRFGVESFHQRLLDAVNKRLDAGKSWEMCRWILTHLRGVQVRLLTMRNLPGETAEEEKDDRDRCAELQSLGAGYGNRVDVQVADCIPMPGTPLWVSLRGAGLGERMKQYGDFNAGHGDALAHRLDGYKAAAKGKP
jgi:anaerobic magnesium-protoporphyrin IX monomethyl ester cyclase